MSLANKFFITWCKKIDSRIEALKTVWGDSKAYTKAIIHDDKSILMDVSDALNYKCYNADYYYIDAVLFKPEDLVLEYPKAYYLTDLRIAFEHENDFTSGLFQEVCHLLQVNCDLKVLVTYPPSEAGEKAELEYLHKIIKKSRNEVKVSEKNSFLMIMGHNDLTTWKGFIYKSGGWQKIPNKPSQTVSKPV